MHRFYAHPWECVGETFNLRGDEAHHALRVLRVQVGETVTVLNGAGLALLCRVTQTGAREMALRVVERRETPVPSCQVTLFQAIPKGKTMEDIIHKATELGVHRIVPLISEHVIARPDEGAIAKKAEKWQGAAIEAIKQCGQVWLPQVEPSIAFTKALQIVKSELEMIGALYPGSGHPRTFFQQFTTQHGRKPSSVGVWIGPEGDFTKDEVQSVVQRGAFPITLGPLVLKCETAAIYALSVIGYETQVLSSADARTAQSA